MEPRLNAPVQSSHADGMSLRSSATSFIRCFYRPFPAWPDQT